MLAAAKRHWSILWAARFIAPWEGFLAEAVEDDIAAPPILTQGYGHTRYAGPPIPRLGTRWSKAKALRVLAHDCHGAAEAVDGKVRRRIPVRVRIALISAVFNLGPSILDGEFLRALNTGQFDRAASILEGYDHAGGVEVEGLRRRRKAEAWMLRHPHRPTRNPHHRRPH